MIIKYVDATQIMELLYWSIYRKMPKTFLRLINLVNYMKKSACKNHYVIWRFYRCIGWKIFWPILQQFSLTGIAYTWIIKNKGPNGKKGTFSLQAINIVNYLFRTSFYQHFFTIQLIREYLQWLILQLRNVVWRHFSKPHLGSSPPDMERSIGALLSMA